jgi:hypothetical protein
VRSAGISSASKLNQIPLDLGLPATITSPLSPPCIDTHAATPTGKISPSPIHNDSITLSDAK